MTKETKYVFDLTKPLKDLWFYLNPLNKVSPLVLWQKLIAILVLVVIFCQLSFTAFKITVPVFNRLVGMPKT